MPSCMLHNYETLKFKIDLLSPVNPLVPNVAKWQHDLRLQMLPFDNICVHEHFYGFYQQHPIKSPKYLIRQSIDFHFTQLACLEH